MRTKPRIRRAFHVGGWYEWVCSDNSDCLAYAWGDTPEQAYELWLARFAACRRAQQQ